MINLPDITLSREEQLVLHRLVATLKPAAQLLKQTDHPTCRAAVALALAAEHLLWEQNLKLVMHIALPIARRRDHEVDDLFQEGCLVLRTAIRNYDPDLGYRFGTYAHSLIARHLQFAGTQSAYFADSRYFHLIRAKIQRGEAVPEKTRALATARRVDPESLLDFSDRAADPYAAVDDANVDMLAPLTGHLRELIELRFGFTGRVWAREEVAEHFQVSRSTISRWETEAFRLLAVHIRRQQKAAVEATAAELPLTGSISDRLRHPRLHPSSSAHPSR